MSKDSKLRPGTRVVRSGLPEFSQGTPFLPGPTFAGNYHLKGEPQSSPYSYGRYDNPTWTNFERALSELEGGEAVVFSSGMAAITAVLSVVLFEAKKDGNATLVMPSDSYYTARRLVDQHFSQLGIEVRSAPTRNNEQLKFLEGATLLWLETPTNPGLDVCNLSECIEAAHKAGSMIAVDNTTATPLGQSTLELGADFTVSSDTKAISGHGDLILGHVAARETKWAEKLKAFRTQQGAIPGPMEVWLAHRSLATLDLRLARECSNALEIAKLLASRKEVSLVRYPGLPQDPAYEIARKQMRYFSPVVSFVLGDQTKAERFLDACNLVNSATSFGGVHTTAERRARWGGDKIPEGFIRLSAGCEEPQDLLEDMTQALDRINA